jgi:hypothetical protein
MEWKSDLDGYSALIADIRFDRANDYIDSDLVVNATYHDKHEKWYLKLSVLFDLCLVDLQVLIDWAESLDAIVTDGIAIDMSHSDAAWLIVYGHAKESNHFKRIPYRLESVPEDVRNARFVLRDCVDLVRSAITQKLHMDYIEACILFADWQNGQVSGEQVLAKWAKCERLLECLGDLLDTHPDYSMYQTLLDQGRNRPVNPYFEDALKDNLLNNYCRTAAFELVKFVYCRESAVLRQWVQDCVVKGQYQPAPTDVFETQRNRIFDDFKATPLADLHKASAGDLVEVIDCMLEVI